MSLQPVSRRFAAFDVVVVVVGQQCSSPALLHPGDRNRKKYPLRGPLLRVRTYIRADTYVRTYIRDASLSACISARMRAAHHGSRQSDDNDRNRLHAVKIRGATRNRRRVSLMRRPARKAQQNSHSFNVGFGAASFGAPPGRRNKRNFFEKCRLGNP